MRTLLVSLLALLLWTTHAFTQGVIHGRVVGVSDGDTIKVLVAQKELVRVRVAWIDAPEMGQAFGMRAKQAMSEAAANIDSAHIGPGARGCHVEKIQTALNILDNAGVGVDGVYGPATANAVLNYKTTKNIINRSYQSSADNIVGKMTMAKLDEEMRAHERKPRARIEFIPISPRASRDKAYPRINFKLTASNTLVAVPTAHVLDLITSGLYLFFGIHVICEGLGMRDVWGRLRMRFSPKLVRCRILQSS